jgi:hypothetical protein
MFVNGMQIVCALIMDNICYAIWRCMCVTLLLGAGFKALGLDAWFGTTFHVCATRGTACSSSGLSGYAHTYLLLSAAMKITFWSEFGYISTYVQRSRCRTCCMMRHHAAAATPDSGHCVMAGDHAPQLSRCLLLL